MTAQKFNFIHFLIITLLTSIWINISEIFRYFMWVIPRIRSFFDYKLGVADMNGKIFLIWGFWDLLLTSVLVFIFWLYAKTYGNSNRSVLVSSTIIWLAVFVIFWLATANMGLSDWHMLLITLPLSWIEMFVGTWITSQLYKKYDNDSI